MTTGERIKARRQAIGMNAETLAEKVGKAPATIYRYEKGDTEKIPVELLMKIATTLHVTVDFLMGWTDDPTKSLSVEEFFADSISPARQKLLDAVEDMDDEQIEKLLLIIEAAKKI